MPERIDLEEIRELRVRVGQLENAMGVVVTSIEEIAELVGRTPERGLHDQMSRVLDKIRDIAKFVTEEEE